MATEAFPGECLHNVKGLKWKHFLEARNSGGLRSPVCTLPTGPAQQCPLVMFTSLWQVKLPAWVGIIRMEEAEHCKLWIEIQGGFCTWDLFTFSLMSSTCVFPEEVCKSDRNQNLAVTLLAFKPPLPAVDSGRAVVSKFLPCLQCACDNTEKLRESW